MPAVPDFRLYHSNALDVLAGLLARQVAQLPADGDWLRPDIVLVPQFSMRRWLQQQLAEHSGICANLRFLTPGEFVDLALDANLGPAPPGDRLAPDSLRWRLLRELETAPPAAVSRYAAGADPRHNWSLAQSLAQSFEKYQAWRRDLLQRWEAGADPDDWQAQLWRRVARGRAHRARRVDDYLRRFGAQGRAPQGLPPRLFVFACQNMSPDVLQLIASQARAGEQHFYLHTPARGFWGDLPRWAADYVPAQDDRFLGDAPNPLLAAWGQAGRDFIAVLGSGEAVAARAEALGFAEPPTRTLLGRMQADVLDNREPLAAPGREEDAAWPRAQVDRGDPSLQFHACHTRLREVQVLHDQLRALLEAPAAPGQAPLQPRDIAVLAPDIDAYAPHIEAVFGGALGSAREIPYTLADTSPLASVPLAEAFLRLLELPVRPLTAGDVIDLMGVPAVAARFGLDAGDHAALQGWLQDAGARWGLDAADRARHDAPAQAAYTFEFALDRLLLGYATGDEADVAGIAPWPALEGRAVDALDGLLRLLATLRDGAAQLAGPQPPAAWARALDRLLDAAFLAERDSLDAATLKRLREAITGFATGAADAGFDAPVAHAVVLDWLRDVLGQADARAPFLSGGVCFGLMVPMRLIPFRVVCLLGMDEAAFPARERTDPVNRLVAELDSPRRRVGDPSRRDADRYLFLQLFTGAGRVLYLSWCGLDPRDGSAREPSAVVAELLETAVDYHVLAPDLDRDKARAALRRALVVQHALQPFSPAAFGAPLVDEPGGDVRRFSFDARWHPAATGASGDAPLPAFAPALLPRALDDGATLSLDRLRSALNRPHQAFLHEGLGLRLPEEETPLSDHEPFGAPAPLARYALRQAAFDAWLREGDRPDLRRLHATLLARALLAPGADGETTLAGILDDVAPFARCALEAGFEPAHATQPFAATLGTRQLQGVLDDVQRDGVLRVALRPEGRHGGQALRHGLDWLAASLHGLPLHEIACADKRGPVRLETWSPLSPALALASLEALLGLRDEALQAPLPFLPKSGFEYHSQLHKALARAREAGTAVDLDALRGEALAKAAVEWRGDANDRKRPEAGPATRLALRGRDPFLDADADQCARFARIAEELFGAFAQRRALSADALQ